MGGGPQGVPGASRRAGVDLSRNVPGNAAKGLPAATSPKLGVDQAVGCLLPAGGPRDRTGITVPRAVYPPRGLCQ